MKLQPAVLVALSISFGAAPVPLAAADTAVKPVTYAADLKPVFDATCARCHNADKARAGLRMDSLDGVLQGTKKRKLVKPGDSADSRLVKIVESIAAAAADPEGTTKALHKRGPKPFTPAEIALLKTWIDQGAK